MWSLRVLGADATCVCAVSFRLSVWVWCSGVYLTYDCRDNHDSHMMCAATIYVCDSRYVRTVPPCYACVVCQLRGCARCCAQQRLFSWQ